MNNDFKDIIDRLGRPVWYDQKGYPRYCRFHPRQVSDIYANYVAYLLIGCQRCNGRWRVAVSSQGLKPHMPTKTDVGHFHYGDPPHHDL